MLLCFALSLDFIWFRILAKELTKERNISVTVLVPYELKEKLRLEKHRKQNRKRNRKKNRMQGSEGELFQDINFIFYTSPAFPSPSTAPLRTGSKVVDVQEELLSGLVHQDAMFQKLIEYYGTNYELTKDRDNSLPQLIITHRFAFSGYHLADKYHIPCVVFNSGLLLGIDNPSSVVKVPYFGNDKYLGLAEAWKWLKTFSHRLGVRLTLDIDLEEHRLLRTLRNLMNSLFYSNMMRKTLNEVRRFRRSHGIKRSFSGEMAYKHRFIISQTAGEEDLDESRVMSIENLFHMGLLFPTGVHSQPSFPSASLVGESLRNKIKVLSAQLRYGKMYRSVFDKASRKRQKAMLVRATLLPSELRLLTELNARFDVRTVFPGTFPCQLLRSAPRLHLSRMLYGNVTNPKKRLGTLLQQQLYVMSNGDFGCLQTLFHASAGPALVLSRSLEQAEVGYHVQRKQLGMTLAMRHFRNALTSYAERNNSGDSAEESAVHLLLHGFYTSKIYEMNAARHSLAVQTRTSTHGTSKVVSLVKQVLKKGPLRRSSEPSSAVFALIEAEQEAIVKTYVFAACLLGLLTILTRSFCFSLQLYAHRRYQKRRLEEVLSKAEVLGQSLLYSDDENTGTTHFTQSLKRVFGNFTTLKQRLEERKSWKERKPTNGMAAA